MTTSQYDIVIPQLISVYVCVCTCVHMGVCVFRALLQVVQYISEFQCLQVSSPTYLDQLTKIRMKFKQVNGHQVC